MTKQKYLWGSVSAIALGACLAPAFAQDSGKVEETVVVTGRRAALESALKIKENAEQIVDAVVADDAGKLPDNSITEVLQRVSGVTITHFGAPGDPDHYSVEGSGVAIRGMTQINSTLNGRESFSANGGRSLLWEDVPPELMAAVNVYKSATADQLEGGVGGTVDLRTHMPFDFDEFTLRSSAGFNYGDFVEESRPNGSLMVSDRWNTGIGEMGLLLSASYSDIASRSDTIQVEPYYPHVGIYATDWSTVSGTVWIPSGVDYRTQEFDRQRAGFYEAFQWHPTENLSIYQTAFVSYYMSRGESYEFMDSGGEGMTLSYSTTTWTIPSYVLDKGNNVVQADALVNDYFRWWNPLTCSTNYCSLATAGTRADRSNLRTTDLTEGFNWSVNEKLHLAGAFQYVHSTAGGDSNTLQATVMLPYFSLDLRGQYPVTTVDSTTLATASNYNWAATMEDHYRNSGVLLATNLDGEYTPGDWGILKSVKFGMRGSIRKENDRDTGYDYKELSAWYKYGDMHYLSDSASSDTDFVNFDNYFRGQASVPGSMYFPSIKLAETYSDTYAHENYSWSSADGYTPRTLDKHSLDYGETKTVSGYVTADFAKEDVLGMPLSGNAGLRVIYNHNFSSGYLRQYGVAGLKTSSSAPSSYSTDDNFTYREGGRDFWLALPSLNVQIMPSDSTHIRLALSETMGQMSFKYMRAGGDLTIQTVNSVPNGYKATIGQPDLKPQLSRNLDLAFEWFGDGGDAAHISLFYKSIKDYITYGLSTLTLPYSVSTGDVETQTATVTNYFNSTKETAIRGYEVGFTKFANFLPAPFDGLGADVNFTYIDSRAPGDAAYDMNGKLITGLPVDLLSRYSYNIKAMYEKKPFSMNLAWTWRSKYLLTPAGNIGNYPASETGTTCTQNNYAVGGTGANAMDGQCYFALPIMSKAFGQLDAGIQYDIDDNFSVSLNGQNLLNSVTKTTMGAGDQTHNRSWFMSDRRISGLLTFKY
jgi:iron complex outermembrane recepter protein